MSCKGCWRKGVSTRVRTRGQRQEGIRGCESREPVDMGPQKVGRREAPGAMADGGVRARASEAAAGSPPARMQAGSAEREGVYACPGAAARRGSGGVGALQGKRTGNETGGHEGDRI